MKKDAIFSDKKGIIADKFALTIASVVIAIILVLMFVIWSNINDAIQNNPDIETEEKQHLDDWVDSYVSTYDAVFLIYFIGILIAGFLFLLLADTAPFFYFFVWVADLFLLYVSAALANTYVRFQADNTINTFANQFIIIPFVMANLLEIMIVASGIYIVAFLVKTRRNFS